MTVLVGNQVLTTAPTSGGIPALSPVTYTYAIGYDWDENGGVFCITKSDGKPINRIRVTPTVDGLAKVITMATPYTVNGLLPPIVVEDTRRPMLTQLSAQGFPVYVANSDALTYYRQSQGKMKKQKTDQHDAALLAMRFLLHPGLHRNLPPINVVGIEVTTLARMEADVTRQLVDASNRLRSMLAEANPAVLQVWRAAQLSDGPTPCTWLQLVPTAQAGQALNLGDIEQLMIENKIGGGRRNGTVKKLHEAYQTHYLTYDKDVDEAIGRLIHEQAAVVLELIARRGRLETRLAELTTGSTFGQLFLGATGLGNKTLARIIGEVGTDPDRFTNLRGFLAFAACVPYTEQSGSMQRNRRRRSRGNELHAAFRLWADAAKHHHPGAKAYYWTLREKGDFHSTALRKVMTKIARAFWHCSTTGEVWDDDRIWKPARPDLNEWVEEVKAKTKKTQKTPVTAA